MAIKLEKPHLSFGQVANECRRQTANSYPPKNRIYKRSSEREVERELRELTSLHQPDFRLAEILKLWSKGPDAKSRQRITVEVKPPHWHKYWPK